MIPVFFPCQKCCLPVDLSSSGGRKWNLLLTTIKPILLTVHIQLCIVISVSQKMKHQPAWQWERSTKQKCASFTRNYKSWVKEKQINFTLKWHISLSRECNVCTPEALLSLGFSVNSASYFLLNLPAPQENPNKTKQTMENVKACSSYISIPYFF